MKKFLKKLKDEYAMVIFLVFTVVFVIGMSKILPDSKSPTKGIPHNYWIPRPLMPDSVTDIIEEMEEEMKTFLERDKEDIEWTGTTQGIDTSYIEYDAFVYVPAGADSIIIVAGILYRKGEENWIPIYLDDNCDGYIDDGDTIWE
jgi:hypothetical protein